MDDFAVDIDAVLDDFELSEGDVPNKAAPSFSAHPQYGLSGSSEQYASATPVSAASIAPLLPGYPQGPVSIPSMMYNMHFEHAERLNLEEADFAPAPPRCTQSIVEELQACRDKPIENGHVHLQQDSERSSLDTSESSGVSMSGSDSAAQNNGHIPMIQTNLPNEADFNVSKGQYSDSPPELLKSTAGAQRRDHHAEISYHRTISAEDYNVLDPPPVTMAHPDVIPTNITPISDVAKASCHETHSDSGVSISTSEQSLQVSHESIDNLTQNTSPVHQLSSPAHTTSESSRQSISPEPTIGSIPEQDEDELPRLHREEISAMSANINATVCDVVPPSQCDSEVGFKTDTKDLKHNEDANMSNHTEVLPGECNVTGPESRVNTKSPESPSKTMIPGTAEEQSGMSSVGFDCGDDMDLEEGDMEAYLADMERSEQENATISETVADIISAAASRQEPDASVTVQNTLNAIDANKNVNQSDAEQQDAYLSTQHDEDQRRGSSESMEKFLVPSITSPAIKTPMEDTGFSKVPGFSLGGNMTVVEEDKMSEEEEEAKTSVVTQEAVGQIKGVEGENNQQPGMAEPKVQDAVDGGGVSRPETLGSARPGLLNLSLSAQPVMMAPSGEHFVGAKTIVPHGELVLSKPTKATVASTPPVVVPGEMEAMQVSKSPTGIGARPKDPSQMRKNRPNSLLGLSKPDIKAMSPVPYDDTRDLSGGNTEQEEMAYVQPANATAPPDTVENSHDIINRQLAQNKKSPLRKKQLNLEIKQQIDNGLRTNESDVDNKNTDDIAVSVLGPQVKKPTVLELGSPSEGYMPVSIAAQYQPFQVEVPQYVTQPPPNQVAPQSPLPGPGINGPASSIPCPQLDSVMPAQVVGAQPDSQTGPPKQRRPTSLNIIPHGEFSSSGNEDTTPADDTEFASSEERNDGSTSFQPSPVTELAPSPSGGAAGAMLSPLEAGPGAFSPPMSSANMNVAITELGKVAPRWVPDADAPNCMQCEARFTFTKRRHHCRACGKVFCSACCNLRCKLHYMENKEARVCSKCYQDIVRAQAYERLHSPGGPAGVAARHSPNPNNPSEYCSTVPPLQQAAASLNAPPPTVMVPVGVLRKEGSQRNREPKQVIFSDGIRPGGDLTELDGSSEPRLPLRKSGRSSKRLAERMPTPAEVPESGSGMPVASSTNPTAKPVKPSKVVVREAATPRSTCLIPEQGLPPVILSTGIKGDYSIEENPDQEKIMSQIRNAEDESPVVFAINKNLFVLVKIVNLDCCVNRVCWCFTSKGMCTVGQDEMVIVLECLPDEKEVPRDIFCHLNSVYEEAGKGNTVSHLGHTIFGQSFLDSKDHCGFLYIRPSFQCLQKLLLPPSPYVFGILLQKWETPWAKVFPVRLMLRLGAEYRYYPCPLISVRFRKPVFGEIGHTIMNLLADFRNYQYMLPQIRGVTIHMEDKKTYISFPKNRYDDVMKVINNSNDHVMALGANFSIEADSHLVCIQNEDGNYQTQAINIQNKPRKVTGASFVVFNGALKTSSGLRAKSSIVEDGLMVQITADSMIALKQALRDMTDYTIGCGAVDSPQPEEQVYIYWAGDDRNVNQGVRSPIDNMAMDGVESIHIHNATDYVGETRTIRWTEVFFIQNEDHGSRCEPVDLSRLAETLAQAFCMALTSHLDSLKEASLTKLGLRVTIDRDSVGYEAGSSGDKLPDFYMNDLDNELIPVIHNAASQSQEGPVVLELIFHVIE